MAQLFRLVNYSNLPRLDWVLHGFTILYIVDYHSPLYGTSCQPKKHVVPYGYESKRGTRMVSYDSRLDVGLSENSVPLNPLNPMVNDHYPVFKWL